MRGNLPYETCKIGAMLHFLKQYGARVDIKINKAEEKVLKHILIYKKYLHNVRNVTNQQEMKILLSESCKYFYLKKYDIFSLYTTINLKRKEI